MNRTMIATVVTTIEVNITYENDEKLNELYGDICSAIALYQSKIDNSSITDNGLFSLVFKHASNSMK